MGFDFVSYQSQICFMSNRNVRVSELLKREISDILHTRYQDRSVALTITGVDVAPDHSNARVYYSSLVDGYDQVKTQNFLNSNAGRIRFELGKRIVLKRMPALQFQYDESLERGARMTELLDSFEFSEDEAED